MDGHCFVCVDGKLVLEVTDPSPINSNLYTKIGFEAYSSFIQIRNVKVRRIVWDPSDSHYSAEF